MAKEKIDRKLLNNTLVNKEEHQEDLMYNDFVIIDDKNRLFPDDSDDEEEDLLKRDSVLKAELEMGRDSVRKNLPVRKSDEELDEEDEEHIITEEEKREYIKNAKESLERDKNPFYGVDYDNIAIPLKRKKKEKIERKWGEPHYVGIDKKYGVIMDDDSKEMSVIKIKIYEYNQKLKLIEEQKEKNGNSADVKLTTIDELKNIIYSCSGYLSLRHRGFFKKLWNPIGATKYAIRWHEVRMLRKEASRLLKKQLSKNEPQQIFNDPYYEFNEISGEGNGGLAVSLAAVSWGLVRFLVENPIRLALKPIVFPAWAISKIVNKIRVKKGLPAGRIVKMPGLYWLKDYVHKNDRWMQGKSRKNMHWYDRFFPYDKTENNEVENRAFWDMQMTKDENAVHYMSEDDFYHSEAKPMTEEEKKEFEHFDPLDNLDDAAKEKLIKKNQEEFYKTMEMKYELLEKKWSDKKRDILQEIKKKNEGQKDKKEKETDNIDKDHVSSDGKAVKIIKIKRIVLGANRNDKKPGEEEKPKVEEKPILEEQPKVEKKPILEEKFPRMQKPPVARQKKGKKNKNFEGTKLDTIMEEEAEFKEEEEKPKVEEEQPKVEVEQPKEEEQPKVEKEPSEKQYTPRIKRRKNRRKKKQKKEFITNTITGEETDRNEEEEKPKITTEEKPKVNKIQNQHINKKADNKQDNPQANDAAGIITLDELEKDHPEEIKTIREALEQIELMRAVTQSEIDELLRQLGNNNYIYSMQFMNVKSEIERKKKELAQSEADIKELPRAVLRSLGIFDYGEDYKVEDLKEEDYMDENTKKFHEEVLRKNGFRVGRTKAGNNGFISKCRMLDPILQADYIWKPSIKQEVKDAYEWLSKYYIVHDKTLEKKNEEIKEIPIPNYKIDLPDAEQVLKEYEKQHYNSNNCFACAGAELYRQYCRKNGLPDGGVNQDKIRGFKPTFKKYSDYKDLVDEVDPGTEENDFKKAEREVRSYLTGGKVGNVYELGDYFVGQQKGAMLNKVNLSYPSPQGLEGEQLEKHFAVYKNIKAVFMEKVYEALSAGCAVSVVRSLPKHYTVIVGIDGDKVKCVDSLASKHGQIHEKPIEEYLPTSMEQSVELVWMSKRKTDEELLAEYKNLTKDKDGNLINTDPTVDDITMVAQTGGINITKPYDDMKFKTRGVKESIYIAK